MVEPKKSQRQIFIDGDEDGIPMDMDDVERSRRDYTRDLGLDFSKKFGLTDNLYILIGIDLRWLKRYNPKNHVIF